MKKNRALALVLCAIFCFVMAFSVIFISMEAFHDCTGGSCKICPEIEACVVLIKGITLVAAAVFIFMYTGYMASCFFWQRTVISPALNTLFSLKVMLRI